MTSVAEFGTYQGKLETAGKLAQRVKLEIAVLKEATEVIIYHHYLHRGRTMAQLPYWIMLDEQRVGVLLFAYPRLSVPLHGVKPMNMLELARMWLSPTVQGGVWISSSGKSHAVAVASCALGQAIRQIRLDWYEKYPNLPDVEAIVSWADTEHHEGTVYRATNFKDMGQSGGTLHGSRRRNNGGRDQLNPDYKNIKTLFMYRYKRRL